jgi:hypothetical protein
MKKKVSFENHCIVSCGILRPELTFLMESGFLDAHKLLFTPPGLHVLCDELENQLLKALTRAREQCPFQDIIVVYGRKCYTNLNDASKTIDSIIETQGTGIKRVQAEYGYDMLADIEQRSEMSEGNPDKILWFTPGWLKAWKTIYQKYFGWDKADANANFPGCYRKIVVLDEIGAMDKYNTEEPETILELFDWTGVEVEFRQVDPDRLRGLLTACV